MSNHNPFILWWYITATEKKSSLRAMVRQIYQIKSNILAHRISCWKKSCMTGLVLLKMFNSKYMSLLKDTIWSVWSQALNLRNNMENHRMKFYVLQSVSGLQNDENHQLIFGSFLCCCNLLFLLMQKLPKSHDEIIIGLKRMM